MKTSIVVGDFEIQQPQNGKLWIHADDGGEFDEELFAKHIQKFYKKYF